MAQVSIDPVDGAEILGLDASQSMSGIGGFGYDVRDGRNFAETLLFDTGAPTGQSGFAGPGSWVLLQQYGTCGSGRLSKLGLARIETLKTCAPRDHQASAIGLSEAVQQPKLVLEMPQRVYLGAVSDLAASSSIDGEHSSAL